MANHDQRVGPGLVYSPIGDGGGLFLLVPSSSAAAAQGRSGGGPAADDPGRRSTDYWPAFGGVAAGACGTNWIGRSTLGLLWLGSKPDQSIWNRRRAVSLAPVGSAASSVTSI